MADQGKPVATTHLGRWLKGELASLNARDDGKRGAQWIADNARDPMTGKPAFERVAAQKWISGAKTEPEAASRRALAALFKVRRSFINNLIALDHDYGDEDPPVEWPHFITPAAAGLSSRGRTFLSMAAEYACRDEGLIE